MNLNNRRPSISRFLCNRNIVSNFNTMLFVCIVLVLSVFMLIKQEASACPGNPNCPCPGISTQQELQEMILKVDQALAKYAHTDLALSGQDSLRGSFGGTQDLNTRFRYNCDRLTEYNQARREKNKDGSIKIYDSKKDGTFFNRNNRIEDQVPSKELVYTMDKDVNRIKYLNNLTNKIETYETIVKYGEEQEILEQGKFSEPLKKFRHFVTNESKLANTNLQKRYNTVGIISPTLSTAGGLCRSISGITKSHYSLDSNAKVPLYFHKAGDGFDKVHKVVDRFGTVGKITGRLVLTGSTGLISIGSGLYAVLSPDVTNTTRAVALATSVAAAGGTVLGVGGVVFDVLPIYNKKVSSINKELDGFKTDFDDIRENVASYIESKGLPQTEAAKLFKKMERKSGNDVLKKFEPKNRTFCPNSFRTSKGGSFNEKTPLRSPQYITEGKFEEGSSRSVYLSEKDMMGITPEEYKEATSVIKMNEVLESNEVVHRPYIQPKLIPVNNEQGTEDFIFQEILPKNNVPYVGTVVNEYCASDCSFTNMLLNMDENESIASKDIVTGIINDVNRNYNRKVCEAHGTKATLDDSRDLFIETAGKSWQLAREKDFGGSIQFRNNMDKILLDGNGNNGPGFSRQRMLENRMTQNDWQELNKTTRNTGNYLKAFGHVLSNFEVISKGNLFQNQLALLDKVCSSNNNSFTAGDLRNFLWR